MLVASKGLIVETLSVSLGLPTMLKSYGQTGIIEFDEIFNKYWILLFPFSSKASWTAEIGKSMEIVNIFCPILISGLLIILKVIVSTFNTPGINFE